MLKKSLLLLSFFLFSYALLAQDESLFKSDLIPSELKVNANSVIRLSYKHVNIKSSSKMVVTLKRIITVLNKQGNRNVDAYVNYDEGIRINKLEVLVFDANGNQIKKIKKKDFKDQSAVAGGTLYSDARIKYLDYTPIEYPYTIEFTYETETENTAFIPGFYPLDAYYLSVEMSEYILENLTGLETRYKEQNFDGFDVRSEEGTQGYKYTANLIKAIKPEDHSPKLSEMIPKVMFALNQFTYEGYSAEASNWTEIGKWMYSNLLVGRTEISDDTKKKNHSLVDSISDPISKAKVIYDFVQTNTRYISVQVGVGGLQPISALEVDKLKYGDCKGLTNYTKAIFDELGIESYYTLIYGGRNIRNIDDFFSSAQGNHAILCLPIDSDYVWLECTSQTTPFGYNANFTDDRDALIITPEGGKIVHTKVYKTEGNLLDSKTKINLDASGNIDAEIVSKSYSTQYGHHDGTENLSVKDQKSSYKDYWSYINGLDISEMNYNNDKDSIVFTESVKVSAERYAAKAGNRLLLQPNFFNRIESAPKRYAERTLPFEIDRGFIDTDSYEIKIPSTLQVEALMDPVSIKNKFGTYKASITQVSEDTLLYQREFIMNKGSYTKEEYGAFRDFWLQVVKNDKSKIVLKTKS